MRAADRRPLRGVLLAVGALSSLGCVGVGADRADGATGAGDSGQVGSIEELRDLIQAGAVAPVVVELRDEESVDGSNELPALGIPSAGAGDAGDLDAGDWDPGDWDPGDWDDADLDAELAALAESIENDGPLEPIGGAQGGAAARQSTQPGSALGDTLPRPGLAAPAGGPPSARPDPNPFLEFGERIIVHADGRITKPFQVAPGKGRALMQMMGLAQTFAFEWTILQSADGEPPAPRDQALAPEIADIILLEKWDFELYQNFTINLQQVPQAPQRIDLADWLVVTAGRETMRQVQDFIELFAGSVPQIEITASIVEFTFSDELDYGVTGPDGNVLIDFPDGTFVDSLSYQMPNSIEGVEALLSIGAIQDGVALNALLEAVQSWENVNIRTNPRIAVREGGVAEIVNTRQVLSFEFGGINSQNGNFSATQRSEEVGVKLYVAPRVMGSDTIALNLFIEASQQIGTSVAFKTADGEELRSPLIATRQARTVVYLEPGQAIVIGGLVSEREEEAESKVPILGDIPLLGFLFRSTRIRKERTEVLFLIQPRILEGVDYNQPVWDGSSSMPLRG